MANNKKLTADSLYAVLHRADLEHVRHKNLPCSATTQFAQELSRLDPRRRGYGTAQPTFAPLGRVKAHALHLLRNVFDRTHQLLAPLHFRHKTAGAFEPLLQLRELLPLPSKVLETALRQPGSTAQ